MIATEQEETEYVVMCMKGQPLVRMVAVHNDTQEEIVFWEEHESLIMPIAEIAARVAEFVDGYSIRAEIAE